MAKDSYTFHAATNAVDKEAVSPLPNKEFGSVPTPVTVDAGLKVTRSPLGDATMQGRPGTNDIGRVAPVAPLKQPDPVRGNRPEGWPAAWEKR